MIWSTRFLLILLIVFCTESDSLYHHKQDEYKLSTPTDIFSKYNGWSEPVQIPVNAENRVSVVNDIAAGKNGIYLIYHNYIFDEPEASEVWLITFVKNTWRRPFLIYETTGIAGGSKIFAAEREADDILHIVWWDRPAGLPYHEDYPYDKESLSEIWYTYFKNSKQADKYIVFEGNQFIPILSEPIADKEENTLYFTFYAGQNDANHGIPSLYLAVKENDLWQIKDPIVTGGGGEASLVQLNSDSIMVAFNAPGFEWIKDNIDSDWRGIFLKNSNDRGNRWNEPLQISRNEWEHTVTASPKLIRDPSGYLHLFWRQDTTGDDQPDNLVHTRSKDNLNWTEIKLMKDKPDEVVTIQNYDIVTTTDGNLHLIYQAFREDNRNILVHTSWNGQKWSIPEILTDQTTIRNPLLAYDETKNQLHLVYGIQDTKMNDQAGILEWLDDNMKWNTQNRPAHDHLSGWSWYHMVYTE